MAGHDDDDDNNNMISRDEQDTTAFFAWRAACFFRVLDLSQIISTWQPHCWVRWLDRWLDHTRLTSSNGIPHCPRRKPCHPARPANRSVLRKLFWHASETLTRDTLPASLKKILNLNQDLDHNDDGEGSGAHDGGFAAPGPSVVGTNGEPVWKVLVFDDLGRDVISSVLRVSDLRAMGVTMHMYVRGGEATQCLSGGLADDSFFSF